MRSDYRELFPVTWSMLALGTFASSMTMISYDVPRWFYQSGTRIYLPAKIMIHEAE
jgi:hypothetical protein